MTIEVFKGKPATDEEMKAAGLTVQNAYEGVHDFFAPVVDPVQAAQEAPVKVVYVERPAPVEVKETTQPGDASQTYDLDTIF